MNKRLLFIFLTLYVFSNGNSQTMGFLPEKKQVENAGIFQSDPDLPIMGPSFEVFACKMRFCPVVFPISCTLRQNLLPRNQG